MPDGARHDSETNICSLACAATGFGVFETSAMPILAASHSLKKPPLRITVGIALSLVLHTLLLLALRGHILNPGDRSAPQRMTLKVFLPPLLPKAMLNK